MAELRKIDEYLTKLNRTREADVKKQVEFIAAEDEAGKRKYEKQKAEEFSKKSLLYMSEIMSKLTTDEAKQNFSTNMHEHLKEFYRRLEKDGNFYHGIEMVLDAVNGYFIAKEDNLSLREYIDLFTQMETFGEATKGAYRMERIVENICRPEEPTSSFVNGQ